LIAHLHHLVIHVHVGIQILLVRVEGTAVVLGVVIHLVANIRGPQVKSRHVKQVHVGFVLGHAG